MADPSSFLFAPVLVTILLVFLSSSPALVDAKRRPICDRSLLTICYNQLQPFFVTNNLRLVLRGIVQNSQHRPPAIAMAGNKHGRSQSAAALPLPLHRIYAEFREFCDLYSTFSECLDAHGAADCMQADLLSELSNVVVTVNTRRDRSNGAQTQQQSPVDLIRDFDHYRRVANSFCVETHENMKIHIVRCLAHAIASSSLTLDDHKGATWADSHLAYIDGSSTSLAGSTAATCTRWMRQSQAPLIQAFFRQEGCGEHLTSALHLSSFLAELTMRTTNATEAGVSPKFGLCVRHLSPKIFESIINETFYNLVIPSEENTQPPMPTTSARAPMKIEELLTSKIEIKAPILTNPEEADHDENNDLPWLKESENSDEEDDGDDDQFPQKQRQSVVIPMTADSESPSNNNNNEPEPSTSPDNVGYDDSAVLGVSLMMADSPLGINLNNEENDDIEPSNLRSSASTPSNLLRPLNNCLSLSLTLLLTILLLPLPVKN